LDFAEGNVKMEFSVLEPNRWWQGAETQAENRKGKREVEMGTTL
jgi:hypothetical protein